MDKLSYIADDMADEALREAADTFFGRRKNIDEELELFHSQVEAVKRRGQAVESCISCLNYLLLDNEHRLLFWEKAGLSNTVYPSIKGRWSRQESLPVSLTLKATYKKALTALYDELKEAVHEYLYGRYVDHPEVKGKKMITPSYNNLQDWAERLNEEIAQVNCDSNPDDVLAFSRRMDVEESSRRESMGSGLEYNYDKELCLKPVVFDSLGLVEYPELPGGKKIYNTIKEFSAIMCKDNKEQVREVMYKIKQGIQEEKNA